MFDLNSVALIIIYITSYRTNIFKISYNNSIYKTIKKINNHRTVCDVILMDLGLPQMNGIEATKLIHERFSNTHIIELTSHESENEMLACIASGARGYVLKSTSNLQLADIIRAVSTGAFYFDPVLEQIPLAEIPKPNSTNFDNLYSFDNIKEKLSSRELEVFKLVAQGKTNPEIAEELIISLNTAKAHVGNILNKLQLSDRMQIAVLAYKANIVK